jgi:sulfur carrier protein
MMQILINQQVLQLNEGATLQDAIAMLQFHPPFAAAVNQQFVPQARYAQTQLQPHDKIDIIAPVTGG